VGRAASLSRVKGQSTPAEDGNLEGQGSAGKSGTDDYRDKSERFKERACDTCESARGDVDPLPALFRGLGTHLDLHLF
jgi:hypothetical protein